jgi:predicted HTH transcriptional regulator
MFAPFFPRERFNLLTKPFDQITAADIHALCENGGAYESLVLEFKRELPSRDSRPDPWGAGGEFTAYARDRLFREIVAFANSRGGTLVLGIDEIGGNPPRAGTIMRLSRVNDLAARLEDAARACIEPPLGGLQIRPIVMDEAAGAGVVLFRTVASPHGPHRVASDGHAFIRRGASSVKMTMREIQDLTRPRPWRAPARHAV